LGRIALLWDSEGRGVGSMATETSRVRVVLYARVSHIESARD
jgi:hypothetical protein